MIEDNGLKLFNLLLDIYIQGKSILFTKIFSFMEFLDDQHRIAQND